ncbi:MAG TPA: SUMF1/EgtB/PvdO family nonheme iron enzyme, partial [Planctomycetaceae bacterium]|nr:SUMF1/EgtB/PvdO family nonheme iron enzyme [Planctomycetaceae bacterium]
MSRSQEPKSTMANVADPSIEATVQPTRSSGPVDPTITPQSVAGATVLLEAGTTLGPYRLLSKLGEGGMGAVYKAQHEHLDKTVAIKVLPQQLTQHADSVARFKREMKAVGKLEHPHIVRAMDAGEIHGTHFLAMEYVDGVDLQKLVKDRGALSVPNACKAIRQAALALTAAHAAGLIHRDIKPANLLVAKTGQIKLLDLGLARLGDDASQNTELTQAGQAFGTPDYMAPEQWHDAHAADARTDLYALGCTLFYLLTARAPYGGETHRTAANKMKGHVIDPIPDLVAARPDVPAEVVAIYQKLMAKDPAERYQKAAELVEALAPFVSSKGTPQGAPPTVVSSVPASGPTVIGATIPHAIQPQTEAAPPAVPPSADLSIGGGPKGRAPRRISIATGGVAAALLLGVIVITITRKDGTTTKVEVPGDARQIEVSQDGQSLVKVTSEATPAKTGWHGWPADAPKPAIAPFDAAQAKKHQEEWAAYLKVPVEYTNSLGMRFRLIPPGEFLMGSTPADIEAALALVGNKHWRDCIISEAPRHKVILTQPLYLSANEVTQANYQRVMAVNPSHFSSTGSGAEQVLDRDTAEHPVEMVSWNNAAEFCEKLTGLEKFDEYNPPNNTAVNPLNHAGYRLPTEAEWEFGCRGGSMTKYWLGDNAQEIGAATWTFANSRLRTHPTGELKANPFGLHDIHGNVSEWVSDAWDPAFYSSFTEQPAVNPYREATADPLHVLRGGDYYSRSALCLSSSRTAGAHSYTQPFIGFRVALSVDTVRHQLKAAEPTAQSWHGWPADAPKPAIAPFDAAQAKKHQEEWAAYLKVPVEYTNSLGMRFRLIPPGEFLMGSTDGEIQSLLKDVERFLPQSVAELPDFVVKEWQDQTRSERPQHQVILTQPIYVATYETTQAQYEKVMGTNPSY